MPGGNATTSCTPGIGAGPPRPRRITRKSFWWMWNGCHSLVRLRMIQRSVVLSAGVAPATSASNSGC